MDARAVLRVTTELLWSIRRAGFDVATSQAIDVARALRLVGFDDPAVVREAMAAILVQRAVDRPRFDAAFDRYFFARTPRRAFWERLEIAGVTVEERAALREIFAAASTASLMPLLHRGAELDRLFYLAGAARTLDGLGSTLQSGFFAHRLLDHVGTWRAADELAAMRASLVDAFGADRADTIVALLKEELKRAAEEVRAFVDASLDARAKESPGASAMTMPLADLDAREVEEVRRGLRIFAERLRGGERVRRRRARRGRIDPHATLRRAMRTHGVPFVLARKKRRRDKPRLIVLCDVSESVREVARFLLELAYLAQELFSATRTFAFVSDLGETTRLFRDESIASALGKVYGGAIVPVTHNSNYGRVLRAFEKSMLADVDRRTTVAILGDGRANYLEPAADVLDAIRARARALVWLCPEPRSGWAVGDSAMARYAPKCTSVVVARTGRDLEVAARLLVTLRG